MTALSWLVLWLVPLVLGALLVGIALGTVDVDDDERSGS